MRVIGLVLLSIAMMALLLTDADAKRRSSAQGSQAAGASRSWCATYPKQGLNDNCSYSSFDQCWATVLGRGGFCRPNPFPGTAYGTGSPGQVRSARAAAIGSETRGIRALHSRRAHDRGTDGQRVGTAAEVSALKGRICADMAP